MKLPDLGDIRLPAMWRRFALAMHAMGTPRSVGRWCFECSSSSARLGNDGSPNLSATREPASTSAPISGSTSRLTTSSTPLRLMRGRSQACRVKLGAPASTGTETSTASTLTSMVHVPFSCCNQIVPPMVTFLMSDGMRLQPHCWIAVPFATSSQITRRPLATLPPHDKPFGQTLTPAPGR